MKGLLTVTSGIFDRLIIKKTRKKIIEYNTEKKGNIDLELSIPNKIILELLLQRLL